MSINVLKGGDHTHQDDLESFLYVLILFFFSYKGPLSRVELATAQRRAFTHPIGSGQLPHVTAWPAMFDIWTQNNFQAAARDKGGLLLLDDGYKDLIANNHTEINARWAANPQSDTRLSFSIGTVLANCWRMFNLRKREPVTHQRFIDVLGRWLETYKDDEAEWSNCPFDAVCHWLSAIASADQHRLFDSKIAFLFKWLVSCIFVAYRVLRHKPHYSDSFQPPAEGHSVESFTLFGQIREPVYRIVNDVLRY